MENVFARRLMDWHRSANQRDLPWKGIKDPYKIWISEILLQQTRAPQAIPYYHRFTETFPRVQDLASAPEDQVFRLWQGLGYYNRCRNLLKTARIIVQDFGGQFPHSYEALISLPGIGPYTAAAIASFAFGLPHAVVDGNVIRLLARHFGIEDFPDTQPGRARFHGMAQQLLSRENPGDYNQAIMDLGAQICKPRNPDCSLCPFPHDCLALQEGKISQWPRIRPRPPRKIRFFHYLILVNQQRIWVRKRESKDIWRHLYEPLLIEADSALDGGEILERAGLTAVAQREDPIRIGEYRQLLSHQQIRAAVFHMDWPEGLTDPCPGGRWQPMTRMSELGFPQKLVPFMQSLVPKEH